LLLLLLLRHDMEQGLTARELSGLLTAIGVAHEREGTVRVFRQKFKLEGAIEFYAFAPVEALACV
jgi:hypothetical protein